MYLDFSRFTFFSINVDIRLGQDFRVQTHSGEGALVKVNFKFIGLTVLLTFGNVPFLEPIIGESDSTSLDFT